VSAPLPFDEPTSLAERVEAALGGLDEAGPASPDAPDAFEAVDAAILAELRRLEDV
jgi:hypothetical protein